MSQTTSYRATLFFGIKIIAQCFSKVLNLCTYYIYSKLFQNLL